MENKTNWDLRFNLTEDMNNMMIELLITQQMLKDSKIKKKDKILLENHKLELMEQFKNEFQKHNQNEIKKYNEMMEK